MQLNLTFDVDRSDLIDCHNFRRVSEGREGFHWPRLSLWWRSAWWRCAGSEFLVFVVALLISTTSGMVFLSEVFFVTNFLLHFWVYVYHLTKARRQRRKRCVGPSTFKDEARMASICQTVSSLVLLKIGFPWNKFRQGEWWEGEICRKKFGTACWCWFWQVCLCTHKAEWDQ